MRPEIWRAALLDLSRTCYRASASQLTYENLQPLRTNPPRAALQKLVRNPRSGQPSSLSLLLLGTKRHLLRTACRAHEGLTSATRRGAQLCSADARGSTQAPRFSLFPAYWSALEEKFSTHANLLATSRLAHTAFVFLCWHVAVVYVSWWPK